MTTNKNSKATQNSFQSACPLRPLGHPLGSLQQAELVCAPTRKAQLYQNLPTFIDLGISESSPLLGEDNLADIELLNRRVLTISVH